MFGKGGSAGTLRPAIMAKCGFGGARPPGEPPGMTQSWRHARLAGYRLVLFVENDIKTAAQYPEHIGLINF